MISFLLRSALCHDPLPSATFSRVSLTKGHPSSISPQDRTAVIVDAPPSSFNYSLTAFNSQSFHHSSPYASRHLLVTGETLTVGSLVRRLELSMWLLPDGVCSAASVVLSSARFLAVKARLPTHAGTMCFFSQTGFHEANLVVHVKSKDKGATISIHSATSPAARPCWLGEHCRANEHSPFFVRISADPNHSVGFRLSYEVDRPAPGAATCSLPIIPWDSGKGSGTGGDVFPGVKLSCKSKARDIVGVVGFIGLAILGIFLIGGYLHALRFGNVNEWLFPDEEAPRLDSLRRLPYVSST
jgi:hypothetical protein